MICITSYVPGTGTVFTAVITPYTRDYCCYFSTTLADTGNGALYWCCPLFTAAAAAAAPGSPAAALYY